MIITVSRTYLQRSLENIHSYYVRICGYYCLPDTFCIFTEEFSLLSLTCWCCLVGTIIRGVCIFYETFSLSTANLKQQQQRRQQGSGVVRPGPMKALPLSTLVTNAAHLQEHLKSATTGSGEFVCMCLKL